MLGLALAQCSGHAFEISKYTGSDYLETELRDAIAKKESSWQKPGHPSLAESMEKFGKWHAEHEQELKKAKLDILLTEAQDADPLQFDIAAAFGALKLMDFKDAETAAGKQNLFKLLIGVLRSVKLKVGRSVGGWAWVGLQRAFVGLLWVAASC